MLADGDGDAVVFLDAGERGDERLAVGAHRCPAGVGLAPNGERAIAYIFVPCRQMLAFLHGDDSRSADGVVERGGALRETASLSMP